MGVCRETGTPPFILRESGHVSDRAISPIQSLRAVPIRYALSPGVVVMLVLAAISGVFILAMETAEKHGELSMWTFAEPHYDIYVPQLETWNASGKPEVDLYLIGRQVMDRRMLGGFLGEVPTADLLEAERSSASLAFAGPLETVGFLDLTDRLNAEGLMEEFNAPSLSPWTYEGRVFGLPHDVHPVMLAYRADLVEEAGIDMSEVETWDDLYRLLAPLQKRRADGDETDRYVMSIWDSESDMIETLLLQSGGGAFTDDAILAIDRDINVRTVAEMVSWMIGPDRVATHVPEFSPTGDQLKLDGHAICYIMPDWMCNVWRRNVPSLEGKVKLMPLPAWEPGGRRTSVWGGSMLGIAKTSESPDEAWEFAKALYMSEASAVELYKAGDIITPIRSHWDHPVFSAPDPYFGGQQKGLLYIEYADEVPLRPATPYFKQAREAVQNAVSRTREEAQRLGIFDAESIEPIARKHLESAHKQVKTIIDANAFLRDSALGESE